MAAPQDAKGRATRQRLVFLCGSLEPGRDGVGDYTRALARELAPHYESIAIAAINDGWVRQPTYSESGFRTIRLPPAVTRRGRRESNQLLAKWLEVESPDWISLQFVPWSFQRKGVTLGLGPRLRSMDQDAKWHIMCHELWLDHRYSLRQRALGRLQRFAIQRTFKALRPRLLHVTLDHNRDLLTDIGMPSKRLPLFGNLPIAPGPEAPRAVGLLRVVFFGSPPPPNLRPQLLDELRDFAQSDPCQLSVTVVGGGDDVRAAFAASVEHALAGSGAEVHDRGFVSAVEASELLGSCDVGVVRTPGHLMAKGGSLIAMLEHGLAVWAPNWAGEQLDLEFRSDRLRRSLVEAAALPRATCESRLPHVAEKLMADLAQAERG